MTGCQSDRCCFRIQVKFCETNSVIPVKFGQITQIGGGGDYPVYSGVYEVTPDRTEQSLSTANKRMLDDVTVHPIPYFEVSNPSGGKTVTIGGT